MATSKSRSGAASKAAPKKASKATGNAAAKSAGSKKSPASKGSSASSRAAVKTVAAKKSTAAKAAPFKKSAAPKSASPARGGSSTAAGRGKSSAVSNARNGSASASAAGRGRATSGSAASSKSASRASSGARGSSKASADPRNDLEKILQDLMKDIYYAEKKLAKALGKMAKNATDDQLKKAFMTHQSQTEEQIAKLEKAFTAVGATAKAKKCAAMDGLLEEANEHIEEYEKGAGLDAALIVGAQKVEHYEIAAYGSMRSIAQTLGYKDAARIFEEIREQESDTDELLTQIAESVVNLQAENETEDVKGTGSSSGKGGDSSSAKGGSRAGSEDSNAGEDSSSADSGRSDEDDNDGGGRGISGMTDGNDRGEASETGEAMGH